MTSVHQHDQPTANKTDAGNGSYGICRVSNVLRSPSPDPKRSPNQDSPMCRIKRHHSTIALGVLITFGLLMPSTALANPTVDPRDQMHQGFLLALITLALLIEIVITTLILIYACQIEQRLTLVAALTLLNVASFSVFILYLLPKIGSVTITELLIWFTETYAVTHIIRWLGERPFSFRQALAVTFIGNMFSYFVGLAA